MAIKPICAICGKELEEFGAILLGPPDENNKVEKFHLCKECYEEIKNMIRSKKLKIWLDKFMENKERLVSVIWYDFWILSYRMSEPSYVLL